MLQIFLKNVFVYLGHVRPAALSRRGRPCTGHQEWASQPSSLVPASPGPEREDRVLPGCSGSRLCWRDAREDSHEEASAGQKTGGHCDKRGKQALGEHFKYFNNPSRLCWWTAPVPSGSLSGSCSTALLLLLLFTLGPSALSWTRGQSTL